MSKSLILGHSISVLAEKPLLQILREVFPSGLDFAHMTNVLECLEPTGEMNI